MNQKIVRKIFAFLALFAIVASLVGVGIAYIMAPKQTVKVEQVDVNKKVNLDLENVGIQTVTKDGTTKEANVKIGNIKVEQTK